MDQSLYIISNSSGKMYGICLYFPACLVVVLFNVYSRADDVFGHDNDETEEVCDHVYCCVASSYIYIVIHLTAYLVHA